MQSVSDGSWIALQVRLNRESAVALQLKLRGYESFAPTFRAEKALFPGYVFCRYRTTYDFRIVETPWVIRIVGFGEGPHVVDEEELEAIRRIEGSGLRPHLWESISVGAPVRVRSGPLSELEGTLVDVRNGTKLLIGVTAIQQCVAIEVGINDVVPIYKTSTEADGRRVDREIARHLPTEYP